MANLHISISAEPIFHLGNLAITNSMFVSWLVTIGLSAFAIYASRKISPTKKPHGLQAFLESIIESLFGLVSSVTGDRRAKEIFPYIATFFIFILLGNWVGLLPGVGSIGFDHLENGQAVFVPLLRGATADINITLGLAIVSVALIQYVGLKNLGLRYLVKFVDFSSPIRFFIGILELIAEFAKIISFAFRLFGNIFAGEVLLAVMAFLVPLLAPLPFIGLEVFVGFIQALVFAMLTLVFMNLAAVAHSEEHAT